MATELSHVSDLTVMFCLRKTLSAEQKQHDPLERSLFDQVWLPLSSFIRPDGSVKTTTLLTAYFRIKQPAFDSFFGGFFFWADGQPWGFSKDDDFIPLTVDYLSYAYYWFEAALKTYYSDGSCHFSIYGYNLSLSRVGDIGIIADEGYLGREPVYQPIRFKYASFWEQIVEQANLYEIVYEDLMRRVEWAAQDPMRHEHVTAIRQHVPSFKEIHHQLQAISSPQED